MQVVVDGGELVGTGRLSVCTLTLDPQTPDLFVPNCERVDHRTRRIRSIPRRVPPTGQKSVVSAMVRYVTAPQLSHGRSRTNAQLFHKWKVLSARAEIAVRLVNLRKKVRKEVSQSGLALFLSSEELARLSSSVLLNMLCLFRNEGVSFFRL